MIFSCNNLHDMTKSILEIIEVGVQLPSWQITLCLYTCMTLCIGVGEAAAYTAFSPNVG